MRRSSDIENLKLETELALQLALKEEQEANHTKFAVKLVERIVFTLLALAFLGMSAYFWHLVINR